MKDSDWRIVYELSKSKSITKTAQMVFKTQSTLTKRIQAIEEEFGGPIVERSAMGIVFTKAGAFLAKQAEHYLRFLEETHKTFEQMKQQEKETLVLGSAYTYTKYSLDDTLHEFTLAHPNLNYRIVNKQSDVLHQMVLDGTLDAAIIRSDYCENVNRDLLEYTQLYCLTKEPVCLDDLPNRNRISYQTNEKTEVLIRDWWREQYGTEIGTETEDAGYIEFAFRSVAKDKGYLLCFLPDNYLNEYHLNLIPLHKKDGSPVERRTWFIYGKDSRRRPIVQEFIDYIEKEIAIE